MKPLKIIFSASECHPFAKSGGLADVVGTLPRYLKAAGHDVRIVMPRYASVDTTDFKPIGGPLGVPMGIIGEQWCGVLEGKLPGSEVPVYLIEHEVYFGWRDLYNDEEGVGYMDNDNRFVFLSRATMQLCKMLDFAPDILHSHDWHTAATALFLNTIYADDPHFKNCASVLTLHNMQHQGRFYNGLMNVLDVGWEHFNFREIEQFDQVNLLKAGITHATMLSTVSPTYAQELMTPEFGCELDSTLRTRAHDLVGILNGVDTDEWNPARDTLIAAHFSAKDLSGKAVCKKALQKEMNLPVRDVPVIGIISRLVNQKGFDVVAEAIGDLLQMDIQMVLLGSGEPWTHFFFGDIAALYPQKFACRIGYDHALSHRIEAGSDFFLMPSRFEPCGLNQMYSQIYGTLPIVHGVGGLEDTVSNYDESRGTGDGFKFYGLTAHNLINTVGWAVHTWYNHPEHLKKMRIQAMEKEFTWTRSAEAYVELYRTALHRRGV